MTQRTPGRIIQRIKIYAGNTNTLVPMRLVNSGHRSDLKFYYRIDLDDPEIHVSDTSPDECVRKAKAILETALTIVWTDHILVETEGPERLVEDPDEDPSDEGQLKIAYRFIQTGKRAGEPVWRAVAESRDSDSRDGCRRVPSTWIQSGHPIEPADDGRIHSTHHGHGIPRETYAGPGTQALIPDTPFNRKRVESFIVGLNRIADEVRRMLAPGAIARTLAAGTPLLLSPPSGPVTVTIKHKKVERSKSSDARDRARRRKRS